MPETTNRRLAELLEPLVHSNGWSHSPVPGVEYMRGTKAIPRHPMIYTPRIIFVAQGRKVVWLGDESYVYDADNYLVLAAPMPMECETTASEEEPLLGFVINIDPIMVGELLLEMDDTPAPEPRSLVSSSAMTEEILDAAVRLARTFASPVDARVLGPQLVREIVYRILRTEKGDVLRLATVNSSRHGQISRVLRHIHEAYASDLDVATLAREANMGTSAFHEAFREVTMTSPVQYVKRIRLHRARALLTMQGTSAQDAARSVGYSSASQFSREYRRMFGVSPASDRGAVPA